MNKQELKKRLSEAMASLVKPLLPIGTEPQTTLRIAACLGVLVVLIALIISRVTHSGADMLRWYTSKPPIADKTIVLAAEAGMGATAWTGALIAFQLRGASFQISGAFLLLSTAAVMPLVGLLADGALLRSFALVATLFFVARVLVSVSMAALLKWLARRQLLKFNESVAARMTVTMPTLLERIAQGFSLPAVNAALAAAAAIAIVVLPTQAVVAGSTVVVFVSGLKLVLDALQRQPPVQKPQTSTGEAIDGMIASMRERATELQGRDKADGRAD